MQYLRIRDCYVYLQVDKLAGNTKKKKYEYCTRQDWKLIVSNSFILIFNLILCTAGEWLILIEFKTRNKCLSTKLEKQDLKKKMLEKSFVKFYRSHDD